MEIEKAGADEDGVRTDPEVGGGDGGGDGHRTLAHLGGDGDEGACEEEGEGGREGGGAVDAAPACTCRCVLRMRMETEACNAMDVEAGTCTRAWNAGSLSHCLRARLPRGAWCTDAEKHIRPCTPGSEYDFGCGRVHLRVGGGEDGECGVCAAAADVHAHTNPRDGEAEAWPYVSHWARTSAHAPSQLQRASTARANDGTLLPPAETCP
ncbi:hypothetical protein B0H13DRAFT_2292023 [Mycena leptocephala]|nr:hypothetical protein B0H13DRAFT_2292023 [Mycena leptocephala]